MLLKLQLVFFGVIILIAFPMRILAINNFADEFDIRDDSKWKIDENSGSVSFAGGSVKLSSNEYRFPIMYSKINNVFSTENDSVLDIRFKYLREGAMGDGISLGYTGASAYPFYQFSLWQDTNSGSTFMYNDLFKYGKCRAVNDWEDVSSRVSINIDILDGWNLLRIVRLGSSYKIYLNNLSAEKYIYATEMGQCNPSTIFIGNPLSGGQDVWNDIEVDYVRIYEFHGFPTPTPPPSNTRPKIVILPGLGASWNTEAILNNKIVPDSEWSLNDWVTNYVGLTRSLEAIGMVKDRDYYLWNYDWRRPISEITTRFDVYLNNMIGQDDKVDLVGHSLGGLVARSWAQEHQNDNRLNKILTLGSPHYGTIRAYDLWNGLQVNNEYDSTSAALNVLMQLQSLKYGSPVAALRANVPVIHDLLPTFDFLKKSGGTIEIASMTDKNQYLIDKNAGINQVFTKLRTVVATGHQTKEWVNLTGRSVFDRALGIWPEGSPINYSYGEGDGTVLKKSAMFDNDAYDEVTAMHGWMTNAALSKIFAELNLGELPDISPDVDNLGKRLLFMGSPAEVEAYCGNEVYQEDSNGFVMIPDQQNDCRVVVTGKALGVYHLVEGQIGGGRDWNYFENELAVGESAVFKFEPDGNLKYGDGDQESIWRQVEYWVDKLLEKYPSNSYLIQAKAGAQTKGLEKTWLKIFGFRRNSKEQKESRQIVELLNIIRESGFDNVNKTQAYYAWVIAAQEKSVVEAVSRLKIMKKAVPSDFGASSYKWLDEEVIEIKKAYFEGDYAKAKAGAALTTILTSEVWQ